jgi:hypothetical protein
MRQRIWQPTKGVASQHISVLRRTVTFATHCTASTQCASVDSFFASVHRFLQECSYHYTYPCCRQLLPALSKGLIPFAL